MRIIKINGWSEHGTVQGKMLHVLKFILGTKTCGLEFLPLNEKIWKLEGISHANCTLVKETCISVMGVLFIFCAYLLLGKAVDKKAL